MNLSEMAQKSDDMAFALENMKLEMITISIKTDEDIADYDELKGNLNYIIGYAQDIKDQLMARRCDL